ncbi:MAG TPA: HEAT repeat domain-containing protein, partial [Gemmatimonadaceae bacterium]|nr:HEAT repeat domain-containing protein [Gemmatimonadaceae bacterium]
MFAQKLPPSVGQREMRLYAQLLAMTDTRQFDTALIDRALAESWPALRAAATLAIGQVGAERAMPRISRLRALLTDKDVTVAANAAYAIGLLRDSASIAALSTALSANHEVAREAAWAMGEIGAPARNAI